LLGAALVIAITIAGTYVASGWLAPLGDTTSLDDSALPPADTSDWVILGRHILTPLLAGIVGAVVLGDHLRPRWRSILIIVPLAVLVPIACELAGLLFTTDANYHDSIWQIYARTGGGLDYGVPPLGSSIDGVRWTGFPAFFEAQLLLLPFTAALAAFATFAGMIADRILSRLLPARYA
jgi:hypothetical protein